MRVVAYERFVLNMRTRMPFRYGIATLTALPHLFLEVELEVDGQRQVGLASEGLPPKWFTKDPEASFDDELRDMLAVIEHAAESALVLEAPTVFELWQGLLDQQMRWGEAQGHPPLLAQLGSSLVERAVIDAWCKLRRTPFHAAIKDPGFGLRLDAVHPALSGAEVAPLLPKAPAEELVVRHTVGLSDPLTEADVPASERLADGLPQTLEEVIGSYGIDHFKIKLQGDAAADRDRLAAIAGLVRGKGPFAFTLDGNEQYREVAGFRAFWEALREDPAIGGFLHEGLLFVEQPLHRSVALSAEVGAALRDWRARPPIIIDESDGTLESLPQALEAGYAGCSHKNCKGVIKGVVNACWLALRQREQPGLPAVLSGEDLANVGPVALLQDLAVMATLGIPHVERNGHHYFRGLSMLPEDLQTAVLQAHADVYTEHPGGFPTLALSGGRLRCASLNRAPFGCAATVNPGRFTPLASWTPDSLWG